MNQNRKSLGLAIGAALLLSACATHTTDPYTGEQQMTKTTKYGLIGAATCGAGALLDGADKNKGKRVAGAAAVCGAAGAAIGAYVDKQEAALRQRLANTGVSVTRQGDMLLLNMPGNITFTSGHYAIKPEFFETLNSIVLVLKEFNKNGIEILGHTDSVGSDSANMTLSEQRARAVEQYLLTQGIAASRTKAYGMGEQYPIADNKTEAGRMQNRRVEMRLLPPAQ